jgi:hypothetical protein
MRVSLRRGVACVSAVVVAPNVYTVRSENPMVEMSRLQLVTQFMEVALHWQMQSSALLASLAAEFEFAIPH